MLKEYEYKLTEMTTEKENFVIKLNSIEDQVHSIQEEKEQLMTKNQEASEKLALVAQEKNHFALESTLELINLLFLCSTFRLQAFFSYKKRLIKNHGLNF